MYEGLIEDWPKKVCYGPGSVSRLPELMTALGRRSAFVICGRTVASCGILDSVAAVLGGTLAGVYDAMPAHTPHTAVEDAAAEFAGSGADTVVTVGGGSTIDGGKGIALLRATGGEFEPYAIDFARTGMDRAPMPSPGLSHIAVPTTAGSSSDVMPTAGIRDPARKRKLLFWDRNMVPDATVLDPELAVHAGPALSAATGMTAMARCIESLYSRTRQPITTGLALHSARLLRRALPRSVAAPDDLAARADCQMACLMSGVAGINTMVCVVHAIGHIFSGRHGLQHGIAHSLLLAPSMRRLLPELGEAQHWIAEAMGVAADGISADEAGRRAAEAMAGMVAALPVPQRLAEVGLGEEDIAPIAAAAMDDYMMPHVPRPMAAGEVEDLLREVL